MTMRRVLGQDQDVYVWLEADDVSVVSLDRNGVVQAWLRGDPVPVRFLRGTPDDVARQLWPELFTVAHPLCPHGIPGDRHCPACTVLP
jgi:hypothetical protein